MNKAAPSEGITRRRFLAAAGLGIAGVATYGGASNDLEAVRRTIPAQSGAVGRAPLRVALATDMHGPHNLIDHQHLVRAIADFQPHLLCVVGDAVDDRGDEHLVSLYGGIEAPLGKFAVLGNWEYEGLCDLDRLRQEYARAGVELLVNQKTGVDVSGEQVDIVGLDDWVASRPDMGLVQSLGSGDATAPRALVLSHCPGPFTTISRHALRPVVTLSGHTHGGQIAPLGVALIVPRGSGPYIEGWYVGPHNRDHLYVSRGLGNSGPPFRIGSRPEIALLTL